MLGFLVQLLKRLVKKGFAILRDKPKFRKRFDMAKKRGTTLKKKWGRGGRLISSPPKILI